MKVVLLLKPDAMKRRLWGTILLWLQIHLDFEIIESRIFKAGWGQIRDHYAEHAGKDFYPGLIEFMRSGPVWAIGATTSDIDKLRKTALQLRIDLAAEGGPRNLIHCSDSEAAGTREWRIWFGPI